MIILPGDYGFYETLATPPPGWRSQISSSNNAAFIVRAGSELLELVDERQLIEYTEGGEFDQRSDEMIDDDDDEEIYFDM
jgi:hypothetical protein